MKSDEKEVTGNILVADDIEENLVFLQKILMLKGYNVVTAKSGDEAWNKLQDFHPDLALLDVRMPGMDGYEVCRKIKENIPTRDVPVIFISAFHETIDKVRGFEAGGIDYIHKPIQTSELLSRVRTHLNLGRVRNELSEQAIELRKLNRQLRQQIEAHKKAKEEIDRLNESLELRVAQRTAQLLAANQELEAFSYSVSHDLRAPLRAIDGFTRILLEDYEKNLDDEGKRICSVIRDNSQRMGHLIDDLLRFSRLGRSTLEISVIDMNALAMEVFQEIKVDRNAQQIDFRLEPLLPARGDPSMIKQVWFNLIENAIKFTSRKPAPQISIQSREENNMIVYTVKDNGAGFDMQYADKLFGVFQRLHSYRDYEGTGVGLAIVQRIIKRHNGTVWAEGRPDQGSTFSFSLPVTHKTNEVI